MAGWDDIKFVGGQFDYVARLNNLRLRSAATAAEVEQARGAYPSLLAQISSRLTQAQVDGRIDLRAVTYAGFLGDVDAAGYRLTGLSDPVGDQDAATRAWTLSLVTLGGDPSGIPVTSLSVGTLEDGQFLWRSGAQLIGAGFGSIPATSLGVGTTADGQVLARKGAQVVGRSVPIFPRVVTEATTAKNGDYLVVDASAGAVPITLSVPAVGHRVVIHALGGDVVIVPGAANIIGLVLQITPADTVTISDGTTVRLLARSANQWSFE